MLTAGNPNTYASNYLDRKIIVWALYTPLRCCNMDLHLIYNVDSMLYMFLQPIFMWCRVVESVGKDVTEVTKGDTVIPIFLPDCGECIDCKSTKSNRCTNFPFKVSPWLPRHGSTRFTDLNGEIIYHFMFVSSFSEYTVVDIANVLKIDPQIPPDRACLLSCGVSTGSFFINAKSKFRI